MVRSAETVTLDFFDSAISNSLRATRFECCAARAEYERWDFEDMARDGSDSQSQLLDAVLAWTSRSDGEKRR